MPSREDETWRNLNPHPPACTCTDCCERKGLHVEKGGDGNPRSIQFCPDCGQKSYSWNQRQSTYECLNPLCKSSATHGAPGKSDQVMSEKPRRHRIDDRFPNWFLALMMTFALSLVGIAAGVFIGSPIPTYTLFGFSIVFSVEKWFIHETRRHRGVGVAYRLFLNLGLLYLLGLLVWTGFKVFSDTSFVSPLVGSALFLWELVLFILAWIVVSRNSWRWPSMKLTVLSLMAMVVVMAFAGVPPLLDYKDKVMQSFSSRFSPSSVGSSSKPAATFTTDRVPTSTTMTSGRSSTAVVSTTGASLPPTPATATAPILVTELESLRQYTLDLINADRMKAGLRPVALGSNAAAQQHAEDMLKNFYLGHIDSGGMKPYMRYSLAGGLGAVGENAAYSGTQDPNDKARYVALNPRDELRNLEFLMVYDDAASNWGHRDNILEVQHQLVNIGVAYDRTRLALSQQFEETYVKFIQRPNLTGGTLTLAGTVDMSVGTLKSIDIYYDPPPTPQGHAQLLAQPHSYSVGTTTRPIVQVIAPAPAGSFYVDLPANAVIATAWSGTGGAFQVTASVASKVSQPGVYTLLLWTDRGKFPLTTVSLFVP